MRYCKSAQQGMGMLSVLVHVAFVIGCATLVIKLGPAYLSFNTIKSVMDSVAQSREPILGGRPAILLSLQKKLQINNINDVDAKAFTFKAKGDDGFEVRVDYERREHIFYNIDAVVSFNHTVVVKGQ